MRCRVCDDLLIRREDRPYRHRQDLSVRVEAWCAACCVVENAAAGAVQVATMQVETTGLTGQCEALTAELEAIQGDMRTASGMLEAAQAQIAELEARTATAEQDADAATAAKCALHPVAPA